MSTLWQDVRFGIRSLRRSPGFTLTAVLVLAGAVAAITAVFSVVSVFLLRLLPFDEPETLVQIWQTLPEQGSELRVPLPNFLDWKARNTAFRIWARITTVTSSRPTGSRDASRSPG